MWTRPNPVRRGASHTCAQIEDGAQLPTTDGGDGAGRPACTRTPLVVVRGYEPHGRATQRLEAMLKSCEAGILRELADVRDEAKLTWKDSGLYSAAWSEAELRQMQGLPSVAAGGAPVRAELK